MRISAYVLSHAQVLQNIEWLVCHVIHCSAADREYISCGGGGAIVTGVQRGITLDGWPGPITKETNHRLTGHQLLDDTLLV